jgi:hypothetical protein
MIMSQNIKSNMVNNVFEEFFENENKFQKYTKLLYPA